MASLVPAIMTRTAWPAGTALEALAGASTAAAAFRAASTIVGAASTAVWTATAIIAAAITSAAAEGALETLARIAADACGVARKFFARRGCAACAARSAGFSGQQDDVVLGDIRGRGSGDEIVDRDVSGVGAFGFFLAVGSFVMPSFVMFGTVRRRHVLRREVQARHDARRSRARHRLPLRHDLPRGLLRPRRFRRR